MVTNVIFATFTFIFFALEGSIMAQGLELGLHVPLWLGYLVSTLVIFPLVSYGMKVLSTLQVWTTPLWLVLMVLPFAYLLIGHPESVDSFFAYQGENGADGTSLSSVMLAAGVCLSLIAQIAEQIDYLRFMPPRTPENSRKWWTAVILAGPGHYLRRPDDGISLPMHDEHGNPSGEQLDCHVCRQSYERPDMVACQTHGAHICSLCLSTDKVADHVLPAA